MTSNRGADSPPIRLERALFKVLGVPPIVAGLVLVAMGVWLAWEMEQQITNWPHTNAVLLRQDPSAVGTRLVFRYEVGGRQFAGVAFHWGEQTASKAQPDRYSLVAVTRIAYNPKNPAEITDALNYSWEGVRVPIFCLAAGGLLIAGGRSVYRWSRPPRKSS